MRHRSVLFLTLLFVSKTALSVTHYTGFLQGWHGGYVYADQGGGGFIGGNSPNRSDWERIQLIDLDRPVLTSGDRVSIRAYRGQYWSASNKGGNIVTASAPWDSVWETMRIYKRNGSGQISRGDHIGFQTADGQHFVTIRYDLTNVPVAATAPWFSDWETFTADIQPVVYDRYIAAAYAMQYYLIPNPDYHPERNDCTNFVSQCLASGGWSQVFSNLPWNRNDPHYWWPFSYGYPASYSWADPDYLKWFIQYSNRGCFVSDWHALRPGDIIGADWGPGGTPPGAADGTLDHMMIVVSTSANEVIYAQHTPNKLGTLTGVMAYMPGAHFYFFKIYD